MFSRLPSFRFELPLEIKEETDKATVYEELFNLKSLKETDSIFVKIGYYLSRSWINLTGRPVNFHQVNINSLNARQTALVLSVILHNPNWTKNNKQQLKNYANNVINIDVTNLSQLTNALIKSGNVDLLKEFLSFHPQLEINNIEARWEAAAVAANKQMLEFLIQKNGSIQVPKAQQNSGTDLPHAFLRQAVSRMDESNESINLLIRTYNFPRESLLSFLTSETNLINLSDENYKIVLTQIKDQKELEKNELELLLFKAINCKDRDKINCLLETETLSFSQIHQILTNKMDEITYSPFGYGIYEIARDNQ